MKKKLFCLLLVVILSASLTSCFRKDTKYDYDMSKYITLATYNGYSVVIELDDVQRAIDTYLLQSATDYKSKNGDDIFVEILNAYEVTYLDKGDGSGTLIDKKGAEISELKEENLLIEDLGAGNYAPKVEMSLLGIKIGETVSLKAKLPDNFRIEKYAGQEVYMDIKLKNMACRAGDGVDISYTGYYTVTNGDKIEKALDDSGNPKTFDSSNSTKFYIGSKLAIDDFEENLKGMKIGETKEFFADFPSDYGNEDLNGKTAIFEATLNGILEIPIYNNDYVKTNYPDYETKEEFEQYLIEQYAKSMIYDHLTSDSVILSYPNSEYKNASKSLEETAESFKNAYGMDFDTYLNNYYGMTRDEYIKSQMLTEMIYYSIAKAENIVPPQQDLDKARLDNIETYKNLYMSDYSMNENDALESATQYVDNYLGETYIYEETMYKMVDEFILTAIKVTTNDKTFTSVTETRAQEAENEAAEN